MRFGRSRGWRVRRREARRGGREKIEAGGGGQKMKERRGEEDLLAGDNLPGPLEAWVFLVGMAGIIIQYHTTPCRTVPHSMVI